MLVLNIPNQNIKENNTNIWIQEYKFTMKCTKGLANNVRRFLTMANFREQKKEDAINFYAVFCVLILLQTLLEPIQ